MGGYSPSTLKYATVLFYVGSMLFRQCSARGQQPNRCPPAPRDLTGADGTTNKQREAGRQQLTAVKRLLQSAINRYVLVLQQTFPASFTDRDQ